MGFEKDVIGTVMFNLEEETEKEELCRFIDGICPFFISKRTSQDYLDRELAELYGKLAAYCNVPKTCFALLASINRNPDSPYAGSRFELKTKNQFFYDNYCMSVGENVAGGQAPGCGGCSKSLRRFRCGAPQCGFVRVFSSVGH